MSEEHDASEHEQSEEDTKTPPQGGSTTKHVQLNAAAKSNSSIGNGKLSSQTGASSSTTVSRAELIERLKAERKHSPCTHQAMIRHLEQGWSLAPLHSFEKPLPPPPGSTVHDGDDGVTNKEHPPLPPIPSPPSRKSHHRADRQASPPGAAGSSSQLFEARHFALMWLQDKEGISTATGSSRRAVSPGGVSQSLSSRSHRDSLSPSQDAFRVPAVSSALFESKRGYPMLPPYEERITMEGKLRSAPFRLQSSQSPRRPNTRGVTHKRKEHRQETSDEL